MHTHCTNVSFLILILHYKYVSCNHWGKLGKGMGNTWDLPVLSLNFLPIYNYFKIKIKEV